MNHNPTPRFGDQTDMLELLIWLSMERPGLPVPTGLSLANHTRPSAHLTVDLGEFEAWREAFGLSVWDVELRRGSGAESYLSLAGTYSRSLGGRVVAFEVSIAGWGLPVLEPRPAAEWEARLVSLPSDWRAERAA
ncbi:hypothetical protein [Streptomyces sp. NPDC056049]|uniref:hypothetical protein n=1 Tax=Streptomyces sp. NPDC056049 TaxID=3345693 RepID=UPI0035E399EC